MINMSTLIKWLDVHGYIHLNESPEVDESENGPMFTGLLLVTPNITRWNVANPFQQGPDLFAVINVKDKGAFRVNAKGKWGDHFSHDNMTGLYCILNISPKPLKVIRKHLPILKWNNRWWLHPRDISFYFWCHHPILGLPFLWIASLAMIISCYQTYKVRGGVKIVKTDGKLLTWMRCKSFNMPITFAICTWLIKRNPYFVTWNHVASIYFKNPKHPLRTLIK